MPDVDARGFIGKLIQNVGRNTADGLAYRNYFRLNALSEQSIVSPYNGMQQSAVEGSYYTVNATGTRGTGVNLGSATGTTYSATNALFIVANTNAVGGPDVVMDYISVFVDTIAGGTPVAWHWYIALDSGNRYSSGTASLTTLNADNGSPNGVTAYAGTLVATAATASAHDVDHVLVANGASVALTKYIVKFGCQENTTTLFTTPTTAVCQETIYAQPVVIRPGWSMVVNEFWGGRGTSALVGELLAGFIVR